MNEIVVLAAVAAVVILVVFTELAAAVLPVIVVVALVPPEQRGDLAKVLAACDSSHRLRIWPALRLAVQARRYQRMRAAPGEEAVSGRRPGAPRR